MPSAVTLTRAAPELGAIINDEPKMLVTVREEAANRERGRERVTSPSVDQRAYLTEPPFTNFSR